MAFIAAFLIGLAAYFGLRVVLESFGLKPGVVQIFVTTSLVGVMLVYAFVVARIARLRVRLDQAGDNAYYLGLLFTLTSMAVALWEFSGVVDSVVLTQQSGPRQIIGNFGIALASTITGIFLRVILHQMRVDPADLEGMTRIELSEASLRVRSVLESVTLDMGRFHEEVRQRTEDVVATLFKDISESGRNIADEVKKATVAMLDSAQAGQEATVAKTSEVTRLLGEVASETVAAVERLRAVEPPPLVLVKRLDKLGAALEKTVENLEKLTESMDATASTAQRTAEELSQAGANLISLSQDVAKSQVEAAHSVGEAVSRVGSSLDSFGRRLEQDRTLLAELESQSLRAGQESARAQAAAVEVLNRLSEVAKALTSAIGRSLDANPDATRN